MRFCSMSCFTNFSITRQMTQRPDPKDLPPEPKGPLALALAKDPLLFSPREMTPTSSASITPAATPSSTGTEPMLLGDITPTKSGPQTPMLTSPTMMRQLSQEKLGKRLKASLMEPPKVTEVNFCHSAVCYSFDQVKNEIYSLFLSCCLC